jgi:4-aminobutyrate aminotransferase
MGQAQRQFVELRRNALACAAALATVNVLRERLGENASTWGIHAAPAAPGGVFAHGERCAGKGLLIGIELVKDQQSRRLLTREEVKEIFGSLLAHGLLVMPSGSTLRINPPLTLTRELADAGCDILEEVLVGAPVPAGNA